MAAPGGKITPIPQTVVGRVIAGARNFVQGVNGAWFGPGQPVAPMAPPGTDPRAYDYGFGQNMQYQPRTTEPIKFEDLRALADNLPILRAVIETRKDQVEAMTWGIKLKAVKGKKGAAEDDPRVQKVTEFLQLPDGEHTFSSWLRILLEDMLVIDAACIYPRPSRDGGLASLEVIDGSTISRIIDATGRTPAAPDPAYQQIIKGPAINFTRDELMYLPRNVRSNRLYGFSPVEQIILTVNIAIRRDIAALQYYSEGSLPASFGTLPKEWSVDQIKAFQAHFDSLLAGNSAERAKLRFMPDSFTYAEAKASPLKDQYDEWLARVICYAFSVPVTAFVGTVNRATGETMRVQASQEGLVPLQNWIKNILDKVIWKYFGFTDLEFVWGDDDLVDPLAQAQAQDVRIKNGSLGLDEARDEYGLDKIGVGNIIITPTGPVPVKEAVEAALELLKNPPEVAVPPPFPANHNGGPPIDDKGSPVADQAAADKDAEVGKAADSTFRKGQGSGPVPSAHHAHGHRQRPVDLGHGVQAAGGRSGRRVPGQGL